MIRRICFNLTFISFYYFSSKNMNRCQILFFSHFVKTLYIALFQTAAKTKTILEKYVWVLTGVVLVIVYVRDAICPHSNYHTYEAKDHTANNLSLHLCTVQTVFILKFRGVWFISFNRKREPPTFGKLSWHVKNQFLVYKLHIIITKEKKEDLNKCRWFVTQFLCAQI